LPSEAYILLTVSCQIVEAVMWQTVAVLVICSAMLGACGEDHGKKRVRTTADDSEDSTRKAAREAETKLMADPVAGAAALEQRTGEWLEVRDGLILVKGEVFSWRAGRKTESSRLPLFAMPANTPWYVKCDESGLGVTLGSWSDVRGDWDKEVESEAAFSAELTRARLTNEQCKTLVPAVGKKLLAMTR
jgi:hypothetical protein